MPEQKITPEHIQGLIAREQYHQFPGTTVTVCLLELTNGHTVTGTSACVRPEQFDAEIGREVARAQAVEEIWPLEGYRLRLEINEAERQGDA